MVSNSIITNNKAGYVGGGIFFWGYNDAEITNCIIADNIADNYGLQNGGAGIAAAAGWADQSKVTIVNTILWNNTAQTGPYHEICILNHWEFTINYSDIKGGQSSVFVDPDATLYWGDGMIDEDPLFVTKKGFDYVLHPLSPCIDAGDPGLGDGIYWPPKYNNGPRSDMGAYGGPGNVGWLE